MGYLSAPPWDTGIPAPELVRWSSGRAPGQALDIGCGTGTNLLYLARIGWTVSGVDYAPLAIIRARRRFRRAGLIAELITGDFTRLPTSSLRGPFNLILDMGCLHAFPADRDAVSRYVAGVRGLLARGGTFLLYAHIPDERDAVSPLHGITPDWVGREFGGRFSLQAVEYGEDHGRRSAWYTFTAG